MDKELREKIRTAISDAWCNKGKDQTFGKFLDDSADAIDALYQSHYAEIAEKEGLRPENPYSGINLTPMNMHKTMGFSEGVSATLAKVMPWYIAKVAELQNQIDEYNKQSTLTYCVFCGATFPVDDQSGTKVVDHIQTCEKHPLNIERKQHEAKVAEAVKAEDYGIFNSFDQYIDKSQMSDFEKFQWQSLKGGK